MLFLSAVSIAAAFALFSPHLYLWDEQFHALVGKNLAKNPFTPTLIPSNPIYTKQAGWANTTIWLHKQPLFTWQIALSIKFFGLNSFAVRLPSVIFHGILVITIFRIGTIVFNKRTGFIAALLTMHSAYLLGLISGRIGTDHNDFIFLCYITLSFWALFEWMLTFHKKWTYWIGIFAGCAVLTKWLVGLLVFAGWGLIILPELRRGHFWQALKPLLISFGITLFVFAPWQIYTYLRFPNDFKKEMSYNSLHLTQSIENHSGDAWYHFDRLSDIYFPRIDFMIVFAICLAVMLLSKKVKSEFKVYILFTIFIVYLFFTIVETKMPSFTIPVFGLVILIIASGISEIAGFIRQRFIQSTIVVVLSFLLINWLIKPAPTLTQYAFYLKERENSAENNMLEGFNFIKSHRSESTKRIVFGVDFFPGAHISWMFFNNDLAYPFLPSDKQIQKAQQKGYLVAIVQVKGKEYRSSSTNRKIEFIYFKRKRSDLFVPLIRK
ncbi:MAG: ArnT family glycosyltransferase [Fluviicola sp.]